MKSLFLLLALTTSIITSAATLKPFRAEISGWVNVKRSATVTCLGLRCPPSRPYYEVALVKAQVAGYGRVDSIVVQDIPKKFNLTAAPKYFVLDGVRIKDGQYVTLVGDIEILEFSTARYGSLQNVSEVVVPRNQPR